jgi:dihydropyrimidinase/allantoinase
MSRFDTVVTGGDVVVPGIGITRCDLGLLNGRIGAIAESLTAADGDDWVDARGLVIVPGGVDSHFHLGIYRRLDDDAMSETESALVGGATTVITYFRTGTHYLNRTGPYREILPQLLATLAGHSHTDFALHLAPMSAEHVSEIDWLVNEAGVTSFKYYFFYRGLNLAADSSDARSYTMSDSYGLDHLYRIMEAVSLASANASTRVSLSLHCEDAELIKEFIGRFRDQNLPPLEKYSRARPPLAEALSIHESGVLAKGTGARINLLHLSSAGAIEAAGQIRQLYPDVDIRLETTLHHLSLTYQMLEGQGLGGKVNPPIRQQSDVDALWAGITSGAINWVASDHACCMESMKGDDLWPALPGFGGTALLYPVMLSEGYHKRGLKLERVVELVSAAPAKAYGLYPQKGAIAIGSDADLVLIDLNREATVSPTLLHSAQDHTPFSGVQVKGWPVMTMLRGHIAFRNGDIVGSPRGEFLARPARPRDS